MRARGLATLAAGAGLVAASLAGSIAWAQAPQGQPSPSQPSANQPAAEQQPAADPKAILEGACTMCHGVDFITSRRKTHDDWDFTVHRMIDKGAALGPDDAQLVIDYLAKTYPADPPAAPAPAATPPSHALASR